MDCPKCGHAQQDTIRCAACGVYFAKLAPRPAPVSRSPVPPAQSQGFGAGALVVAAVAAGAACTT